MAERIERDAIELGSEGRLIRLQLEELVGNVPAERDAIVRDYHAAGAGAEATIALEALRALRYHDLLDFDRLGELLGIARGVNALDHSMQPRGFRVLAHIPRLPETVVRKVVADFGSLDAVVRASQRDLEAVDGVGAVRAREIRDGLRRLQEHNLVDRYLQL
jgi:diadenylate cyclase